MPLSQSSVPAKNSLYTHAPVCRGCGGASAGFTTIFAMDPMPLAGGFCESCEAAQVAPRIPLTWVQCSACGLVQVLEDVDDVALYSQYNYSSSTVGGMVRHFDEYSAFLCEQYGRDNAVRLLEVGCNDGVLLNKLPVSWGRMGVDPSDIARKALANGTGYELINAGLSRRIIRQHHLEGSFDVVTGSNCLAHISDLQEVFRAVHLALRDGGHFWVEVHDLDCLLATGQWDTIYHEHKVEWSEASLAHCLARIGFQPVITHRLDLHGGLLRACFRKHSGGPATPPPHAVSTEPFARLTQAFASRYETEAATAVAQANARRALVAAYGAAGRATVYLNQLSRLRFDYIVDESPVRAGKFIPGVATPIVPRAKLDANPPEACLITAWSYKSQIVAKNPHYHGKWFTAF